MTDSVSVLPPLTQLNDRLGLRHADPQCVAGVLLEPQPIHSAQAVAARPNHMGLIYPVDCTRQLTTMYSIGLQNSLATLSWWWLFDGERQWIHLDDETSRPIFLITNLSWKCCLATGNSVYCRICLYRTAFTCASRGDQDDIAPLWNLGQSQILLPFSVILSLQAWKSSWKECSFLTVYDLQWGPWRFAWRQTVSLPCPWKKQLTFTHVNPTHPMKACHTPSQTSIWMSFLIQWE